MATRFTIIDEEVIPFEDLEEDEHTPGPPEAIIALEIMGQLYDIVWAPKTLMQDAYGHSDEINQEIVLRSGLRGMQCLDTMIHEVTHAISAVSGVEMSELQVHTMGQAWAQMFKHNPELLVFIYDRLHEEEARDYQRTTRKQRD